MATTISLPINATAAQVNAFIAKVDGVILTGVEAYLQAQLPALDIVVIKQLADGIETLIMNEITAGLQTFATGLVIDGQVAEEVSALGAGETDASDAAQDALVADDGVSSD